METLGGNFMLICKSNDFQEIVKLFRSTLGLGRLMGFTAVSCVKFAGVALVFSLQQCCVDDWHCFIR